MTKATRRVQNLVEERRKLVAEKTAQGNRLTGYLKIYFPQMLEWFEKLDMPLVCELLERWPTLEELQKVPAEELRTFFRQHHCHRELRERRILAIGRATPAIEDRPVVEAKSAVVKVIVQLIRSLLQGIAELDGKIEEAAVVHPDFFIFASLPGAGAVLAPRLLAAFGSQRDRYSCADEVQTYSGIAPVTERSGKRKWVHFRWGLSEVSAAELSRMGRTFDFAIGMGTGLLPATTRPGPRPPRGGARLGLQMDSHPFSMLARSSSL
jgi:transposase